jgi:hypothetical protein
LRLPFSSPPTTRRVTVEVFDPASTRVYTRTHTHTMSVISLPDVGSGVPSSRHRVEQLISLLWLLRHSLLSNRSSIVDLLTLAMCSSKHRPQMVRLQISGVMSQFYMQAASVWRHALMCAGNYRAAYMKRYTKGKRLEEDNCNNVPKRSYMPNASVFDVNPGSQSSPIILCCMDVLIYLQGSLHVTVSHNCSDCGHPLAPQLQLTKHNLWHFITNGTWNESGLLEAL